MLHCTRSYQASNGRWGRVPLRGRQISALTECETDPGKRAEFANLSRAFLRLALQAKGYSHIDIIYEPPPPRLDHQK